MHEGGLGGFIAIATIFYSPFTQQTISSNLRLVCVNDKPTESWQVWESTRKASH